MADGAWVAGLQVVRWQRGHDLLEDAESLALGAVFQEDAKGALGLFQVHELRENLRLEARGRLTWRYGCESGLLHELLEFFHATPPLAWG